MNLGGTQAVREPLGGIGEQYPISMSQSESASNAARTREQNYTLPAQNKQSGQQSFPVTDPNGVVHVFSTREAAEGFKRAIRGK
jgi:hypothetical protein